jgi:mRNA-capping enzyme
MMYSGIVILARKWVHVEQGCFACNTLTLSLLSYFLLQIPCRGRGQTPPPAAVNQALWEIFTFLEYFPQRYVLVHCTHGFNRTGYILVLCTQ